MSEIISYVAMLLFIGGGWFLGERTRRRSQPYVKITEHSSVDGKLITMHYEGPLEADGSGGMTTYEGSPEDIAASRKKESP